MRKKKKKTCLVCAGAAKKMTTARAFQASQELSEQELLDSIAEASKSTALGVAKVRVVVWPQGVHMIRRRNRCTYLMWIYSRIYSRNGDVALSCVHPEATYALESVKERLRTHATVLEGCVLQYVFVVMSGLPSTS